MFSKFNSRLFIMINKNDIKKRADTRILKVDTTMWEYKVGKSYLVLYSPENIKYVISLVKMFNLQDSVSENKTIVHVRPNLIVKYIKYWLLHNNWDWDISSLKVCEYCNKEKNCVKFRANPYNAEIDMDYTKYFICDNCIDELSLEI